MPNENVYTEAHGFKFPNGTTIPIEDAEARQDISEIKQSLSLLDFISNVQNSPASGTDLNSLKTNAIYQIGNWSQYTNPPTGIGYSGCLIVFVVRSYVLQIAYSDSGKKHRFSYNSGSSWNNWI